MMPAPADCCDDDGAAQRGIRPALARRARAIERALPGPPASEQDWRILLGQQGGALSWAMTRRLLCCLDQAARQPGALLDCR